MAHEHVFCEEPSYSRVEKNVRFTVPGLNLAEGDLSTEGSNAGAIDISSFQDCKIPYTKNDPRLCKARDLFAGYISLHKYN